MKAFRWFISLFLIFTLPLNALPDQLPPSCPVQSLKGELSYDEILDFIHDLENGELEKKYSEGDLDKINGLFALLAEEGSTDSDLEEDIDDLLEGEENLVAISYRAGDPYFISEILYGGSHTMLCKNSLSKKWEKTKKFVKKHKKAIIIGAVVVVVTAVVVTVAVASAGSGAACAGLVSGAVLSQQEASESVKQQIRETDLLDDTKDIEDQGRVIGSIVSHDMTNQLSQPFSITNDYCHAIADKSFRTDYADLFDNGQPSTPSLTYLLSGEQALSSGNYVDALNDFDKALQINPAFSDVYLDRGLTHLALDNYEESAKDFESFAEAERIKSPEEYADEYYGALLKGAKDSAKGFCTFFIETTTHPIETCKQLYSSFEYISSLVRKKEWGEIRHALAPEVDKLASEWDTLSLHEKSEQISYILGRYGTDIVITKGGGKAVKGLKEVKKINRLMRKAEKTLVLESSTEVNRLKQVKKLETAANNSLQHLTPSMQESAALYKKAQGILKQHAKKAMPESKVRALIHETGIPTFPRPKGIPKNYVVMITGKGGGMEYVHPTNTHIRVRIMPGKPHSPNPSQQKPYVIQKIDGGALSKAGKCVSPNATEAHIPLEDFIYRSNIIGD